MQGPQGTEPGHDPWEGRAGREGKAFPRRAEPAFPGVLGGLLGWSACFG